MRPKLCTALATVLLVAISATAACGGPSAATETPVGRPTAPSAQQPTLTPPAGQIRPAVVAGSWYSDDPSELAALVDEMLAGVQPVDGEPVGLIVPHAGYAYSGPVAAAAFKQLEGQPYEVAVIIASDHQEPLSAPISVWAEGGFETPLGIVPVDVELAQALTAADPRISFDAAAHADEHPIEIELPFLQRVCPACSVVPVLMGAEGEETVQALAGALRQVLGERRAVVVASSDLSHYPSYDDALAVDGATLGAIETFDPDRVRETVAGLSGVGVPGLVTCACGAGPILVTMQAAAGLGADTALVLQYANSGDSPYGDREQVVGYGAVMFYRYRPPELTAVQQRELLSLARSTLESYLGDGAVLPYETSDGALTRRCGAFVTLKQAGELRGCIGHTHADLPLHEAVQQMAVAAATRDPRFPALTLGELDDVSIEISVLSPYRRLTDVDQIEVGTHGLAVAKEGRQGLLLPQVPVEQGWDRQAFLENLCLKASLPDGCWQEGAALYTFTALVFGEED